jgi:glycosyltransferase involved in cell wall biosynthesis
MNEQVSTSLEPDSPDAPPVPKVSVAMITYNHEKYIAQAIESVLMQQTSFPIELVIGEDCSTDNTRQVVKHYAKARPDIVRPLLHENNLGVGRNLLDVFASCRGEYIAILEGDDFWTDPLKLQKQVDLMESNPEYSLCGTTARAVTVSVDGEEHQAGTFPACSTESVLNLEDVLAAYPFRTLTFLIRSGLVKFPEWLSRITSCDVCIVLLCAEKGPIAFLNDITGTYRFHDGGIWSGSSPVARYSAARIMLDSLNEHFSGRHAKIFGRRGFQFLEEFCLEGIASGRLVEVKKMYRESFRRFAFCVPISYLSLGVSIYGGHKYVLAWNQVTKRLAIRTRIRRLLGSLKCV